MPENVAVPAIHQRRLFFALWPVAELRQQIASVAREWTDRSGGRPVPPENLHVTLAFLGAVPETSLEDLQTIGASLSSPPFELVLDRIESWPGPDILCLTATDAAPELLVLARHLRFSLLARQMDLSSQEFRPHVTLARHPRGHLDVDIEPVIWPAFELVLVESRGSVRCRGGGPTYEILARWPLSQETV